MILMFLLEELTYLPIKNNMSGVCRLDSIVAEQNVPILITEFMYFKMAKMKNVFTTYILNCVYATKSAIFSSSAFHKFVQLLLLLLRNEKIVSSFNF